jgi:hypothetical protein
VKSAACRRGLRADPRHELEYASRDAEAAHECVSAAEDNNRFRNE